MTMKISCDGQCGGRICDKCNYSFCKKEEWKNCSICGNSLCKNCIINNSFYYCIGCNQVICDKCEVNEKYSRTKDDDIICENCVEFENGIYDIKRCIFKGN